MCYAYAVNYKTYSSDMWIHNLKVGATLLNFMSHLRTKMWKQAPEE